MSNFSTTPDGANMHEPLNAFPQCHAGILSQLALLGELPALARRLPGPKPSRRTRWRCSSMR